MKYKIEHQFQFILIAIIIVFFYLSNLFFIKLPFFSLSFPEKDLSNSFISALFNLFPQIHVEYQIYNIQILVIWTASIVFGPIKSLIAALIYFLMGICNLPVFAGGGGIDYFNEPTFGYILSFPLLAFLSGYFFNKGQKFMAVLIPIFSTHLIGILYLFFFKQSFLYLAWYMSFSMIGYDMLFAFILLPLLPFVSFVFNEMFIQEIPVRDNITDEKPKVIESKKLKRKIYEKSR